MRDEDERAFDRFAAERGPALRRAACLLAGDPERGDELAERALARTYRSWRRVGPDGADEHAHCALAAALLGRRRAAGPVGRSGRSSRPAAASGTEPAAGAAEADPAREVVSRALAGLPARRRAVLVLRYHEGLSDERIAARLRLPAAAVAADAEAGLAAIGHLLRRLGRPDELLPAALGGAYRELPGAPAPSPAAVRERVRRGRRRARSTAALAAAVAVAVPAVVALTGTDPEAAAPPPAAPAARPAAGSGLLDWPARGGLTGEAALLRAAAAGWAGAVPAAERPARDSAVLYAGEVDGQRVVLLQAVDPAGQPRLAQLAADAAGTPRLVRAEPLGRAVPILVLPAAGRSAGGTAGGAAGGAGAGRLRLLVPPAGAVADPTLLVLDPAATGAARALRPVALDPDGLSEPVTQTEPDVRLLAVGQGRSVGGAGPALLRRSGGVAANRLTAVTGRVELGAPTLSAAPPGPATTSWYDDGRLLADRLGGPVVIAALGPGAPAGRAGPLRSGVYELRRIGQRWLGYVSSRAGRPNCVDIVRIARGGEPLRRSGIVFRCRDRSGAGAVHALAGPGVAAVRVTLGVGARGQRTLRAALTRPAGSAATGGYTAVQVVPARFPTGRGRVAAVDGAGRVLRRWSLPAYPRPRR